MSLRLINLTGFGVLLQGVMKAFDINIQVLKQLWMNITIIVIQAGITLQVTRLANPTADAQGALVSCN